MSKLDEAIAETLAEEDEKLAEHFDAEPAYVAQAFALFKGRLGWVMSVAFSFSLLAFGFCLYCLIELTSATEPVAAIKWGVGVITGLQINVFLRGFMGSHFEGNRLLREIKRLELRMVSLKSQVGSDEM